MESKASSSTGHSPMYGTRCSSGWESEDGARRTAPRSPGSHTDLRSRIAHGFSNQYRRVDELQRAIVIKMAILKKLGEEQGD